MLDRNTDLRQGELLTPEAAVQLGLVEAADDRRRAVVITHDCDLLHKDETFVEVIVAELVAKPDPQFSYAKNPRRLHLTYEAAGSESLVLELRQCARETIPRGDFAEHAAADNGVSLPVDAKRTLKQWLAARYGRPAFPSAFEARLRKRSGKRTAEQQIAKILESEAKYLVGLFFDLGVQRWTEAADGEPYALSISVVYDSIEGGAQGRASAERVAGQLRNLFEKTYGTPDMATAIALDACESVADTHITLADLRRVDHWRLEYVSLRDDERGDFLPVGEMPV